jgi:hypothetical protein
VNTHPQQYLFVVFVLQSQTKTTQQFKVCENMPYFISSL